MFHFYTTPKQKTSTFVMFGGRREVDYLQMGYNSWKRKDSDVFRDVSLCLCVGWGGGEGGKGKKKTQGPNRLIMF